MPRYHFHTRIGGATVRDPEGEVLPDPDAAWRAARLMILQLLQGGDGELAAACLVVAEPGGDVVFEFPFAEAPSARRETSFRRVRARRQPAAMRPT